MNELRRMVTGLLSVLLTLSMGTVRERPVVVKDSGLAGGLRGAPADGEIENAPSSRRARQNRSLPWVS